MTLTAVSIVLAAASVIVASIFYSFQIWNQTRLRKTDLLLRLYERAKVAGLAINQAGELDQTEQALEDELANLDTPVNLQARADLFGMVHPDKVTFLYLPSGDTVEVPWNKE